MNKRAVFLDLDGTLYFNDKPINNAIETVEYLKSKGYICRFLTNTDSKQTSTIWNKLHDMGFNIDLDEIFTPVTASLKFLESKKEASIYPFVSDSIAQEYNKFKISEKAIDYLIIGDCRDKISYENLNNIFKLIGENTEIVALQKGRYFYDITGKNLDTGAFVSLLEFASNKSAIVLGKPSVPFFNILLKDLNLLPTDVLIVGDDITTDIAGANKISADSALVKTGKYKDQLGSETSTPTYIFDSVADLKKIL